MCNRLLLYEVVHAYVTGHACDITVYINTAFPDNLVSAYRSTMSLHFPCNVAYHSNSFVLKVDVSVNSLKFKLNTSTDGRLELCSRGTEAYRALHLPMDSVTRYSSTPLPPTPHTETSTSFSPLFPLSLLPPSPSLLSLPPSSLPLSPLSPSLIQSCFQGLVLVYVLETLYSNVQRYLDSSGYCVVNRIIYGSDVPLFQLDAVQSFDCFSLRKLLAQLPKLNRKLETEFEGMYSDIHCNVKRVFSRLSCINSHSFRVH